MLTGEGRAGEVLGRGARSHRNRSAAQLPVRVDDLEPQVLGHRYRRVATTGPGALGRSCSM